MIIVTLIVTLAVTTVAWQCWWRWHDHVVVVLTGQCVVLTDPRRKRHIGQACRRAAASCSDWPRLTAWRRRGEEAAWSSSSGGGGISDDQCDRWLTGDPYSWPWHDIPHCFRLTWRYPRWPAMANETWPATAAMAGSILLWQWPAVCRGLWLSGSTSHSLS